MLRTARDKGHGRGYGGAGLATAEGRHLWHCFYAYSGTRISPPEHDIYCRYCNQAIPGNKDFGRMVSSNLSLSAHPYSKHVMLAGRVWA